MKIQELLHKQRELDKFIFENNGIEEYPLNKVKLALKVELGELANEVKCFKYWKKNFKIVVEKVLDEFADCLHFALSLENEMNQLTQGDVTRIESGWLETRIKYEINKDLTEQFLVTDKALANDEDVLLNVITLGYFLGFNNGEIVVAYEKKYQENIRRQKEGY